MVKKLLSKINKETIPYIIDVIVCIVLCIFAYNLYGADGVIICASLLSLINTLVSVVVTIKGH